MIHQSFEYSFKQIRHKNIDDMGNIESDYQ